jgi:hypothetical protein
MSNTNNNLTNSKAIFVNNINFADPDSLKNSMFILVSNIIEFYSKNTKFVTAFNAKKKQVVSQSQLSPLPAILQEQTKPFKEEKFSGKNNFEVDVFIQ